MDTFDKSTRSPRTPSGRVLRGGRGECGACGRGDTLRSRAARASSSRHYDRGARCSLDWDRPGRVSCPLKLREVSAPRLGRAYRPDAPAKSQEAIGPSCAFGTTTPSGKNRGGTPTGELPHKGRAAPDGAEDTDQRLSAFRFLDLFGEWGEADGKTETPPLCFGSQAQGSRATWLEIQHWGVTMRHENGIALPTCSLRARARGNRRGCAAGTMPLIRPPPRSP